MDGEKLFYPLILTGPINAVVVGGGAVGERKVRGLLAAGAAVTLISPAATGRLHTWAETGQIVWKAREYQIGDLNGAKLVFAATDRREVNAQVARDAHRKGILCNVADAPGEGSFHVPAVYRGPDLMIAVSTYGKDPAKARAVRDQIAAWLESERNE